MAKGMAEGMAKGEAEGMAKGEAEGMAKERKTQKTLNAKESVKDCFELFLENDLFKRK